MYGGIRGKMQGLKKVKIPAKKLAPKGIVS